MKTVTNKYRAGQPSAQETHMTDRKRLVIKAGRDTLQTEGTFEIRTNDESNETFVKLVVDATPASARFFAEHYGRSISIETHTTR